MAKGVDVRFKIERQGFASFKNSRGLLFYVEQQPLLLLRAQQLVEQIDKSNAFADGVDFFLAWRRALTCVSR
jgi:hypothetical protein